VHAVVSNEVIEQHLSPKRALAAVRHALNDLAHGRATDEPRHRMPLRRGTFNVMWAASTPLDTVALKAYAAVRTETRQATEIHISLSSMSTGRLRATLRGDLLGQRRTGAASVAAAELLARPAPASLAVFGTGFQAHGQLEAFLDHFDSIGEVSVVGRNPRAVAALVDWTSARFPGRKVVAAEAEAAVRRSDIVVTATASSTPVFDGEWLQLGTHVCAVGSNHAAAREIDAVTLHRSALVVVDSRATAGREAGDLLLNDYAVSDAVELPGVIAGEVGRRDDDDITIFSSQGLAVEDLYAADVVVRSLDEDAAA